MLFGAEVSKVYATSVGDHSRQHLSPSLERLVQPFERAGEKIEQATKDEFETEKKLKEETEKASNAEKPEKKSEQ